MLWERLNKLGLKLWVPMFPDAPYWCNTEGDRVSGPSSITLKDCIATCKLSGQQAFFDLGPDEWVPVLHGGN